MEMQRPINADNRIVHGGRDVEILRGTLGSFLDKEHHRHDIPDFKYKAAILVIKVYYQILDERWHYWGDDRGCD
jgi:hypothetical protein